MRRHQLLSALITAGVLFFSLPAAADELQDISKQAKQGQQAAALERLNNYLATRPKDAQGRFLKGLILTEQGKTAEAIGVFTALTQDYPELPEPYNNLAVLYASQQQYEKARIALEMAIRTHPSYATAHENLGDIYAKLASLSYDKALQLDKGNASAQTKLSMIRDLFTPAQRGSRPAAMAEPAKLAAATPAPMTNAPTPAKPAAAPAVTTPIVPPAAKPAKPVEATPAPAAEAASKAEKPARHSATAETKEATKAEKNGEHAAVLETVNAWAQAWSNKNAKAYLSYYAKDFKVPGGENRGNWEKTRKERIGKPKSIQVGIVSPEIRIDGNRAVVDFKQIYRSDALKTSTRKVLIMEKSGNKWLIQEERVSH